MVKKYVPEAGDIVWIDFNPTRGHEQSNIRPALVLSTYAYNDKTNLAVLCPMTSVMKGYPFEVELISKKVNGVVLVDHIRSVDWRDRGARFISKAPDATLLEVREKLTTLIF